MHTWVWGTMYPTFMDALMPLASLPCQISGRNRMLRRLAIDGIRNDLEFMNGNYRAQPRGLRTALSILAYMNSCPLRWQQEAPDRDSADKFIDDLIEDGMSSKDANDFAYAFDSSWDYDPAPHLSTITAPLTAVNTADDAVNPPELMILEDGVKQVQHGKAVVIPISQETSGHGTHSVVKVWKEHLEELLERSKNKT